MPQTLTLTGKKDGSLIERREKGKESQVLAIPESQAGGEMPVSLAHTGTHK